MRVWGGQAALVGETAEAGRQRFGQWFAGYVTRPTRHPPAKVPTSPPGRVASPSRAPVAGSGPSCHRIGPT